MMLVMKEYKKLKMIKARSLFSKIYDKLKNSNEQKSKGIVIKDPLELLNYKTFHVMAKYIYAKHRDLKLASDWAERLYSEYI